MTAKISPDWLPAGWTLQFKFQKTGRRITHYVNLATGQKFFTKDELIRYTQTASTQCHEQQLAIRQTQTPSAEGQTNSAEGANEHPEWLPKNWFVEFKTYKSGRRTGKPYKIYVDSSTGSRFYSKHKVLQFLNKVEQKSRKSNQKKRASHSTSKNAIVASERPDWLPKNWSMELRTHQSGAKMGRHYKIYIDPSTGSRFFSRPQVFRFLNHVERKSSKSKQKKPASHSTSRVVIEKSTADDLPAGWIKEVKIKRHANRVRRDPYYTDPASGYVFRSKRTALHYLETGEISRRTMIPRKKHSEDQDFRNNEKSQLPAAKRQKVELVSTAAADVLQNEKQKRRNINSKNFGKSKNNKELDLPRRFSKRLSWLDPELVGCGLKLVKSCQDETNYQCVSKVEATQQLHIGSNAEVVDYASADSTVKSHSGSVKKTIKSIDRDILEKRPQMLKTGKTSNTKSEVQPFFCSDLSSDFAIKNHAGATPLQTAANEGLVYAPASIVQQKKNRGRKRMENKSSSIETGNLMKFKKKKEFDLPRQSSKRLIGCEPELGADGVLNEVSLQNATTKSGKMKRKSPCAFVDKATRQQDLGPKTKLPNEDSAAAAVNPEINSEICHEGAILGEQRQFLGTQKGSDSKLEQQLLFCSDPCLEFAIKTLTGAIPLEVAINEGLISTPIANIQQQKNLPETRIEHGSCRKTLFNSTRSKKDCSLPHRSSKRLAGCTTGLVTNSMSSEQACKFGGRTCSINEAIPDADLTSENLTGKAIQQTKNGPTMALQQNDFTLRTRVFHLESSKKSKEPHRNQNAPIEINFEKPELQSAIPWRKSWPDPRFEFAFKSVTGPTKEESFTFQSYFHQQFGTYGTHSVGNSTMPGYALPKVFQSDISSHVGPTAQPVVQVQHEFPVNHSSLSSGNVSLGSCSRVGAQQPYRKENNELPGKVLP